MGPIVDLDHRVSALVRRVHRGASGVLSLDTRRESRRLRRKGVLTANTHKNAPSGGILVQQPD